MNWLNRSQDLLRAASTPFGIKASLLDINNYGAIFTRDAVMSGIAGVLLNDDIIIEGFKQTLFYLKDLQGKQGQIASNFTIREGKVANVSFGSLSPKIDSCTWYLIGVGILIKEGVIDKSTFQSSVEKTIDLLDALEYNGKHLIYIPKGGNWADEYIYEGYILYDQVLRAWGLSLLSFSFGNHDWSAKSDAIINCIKSQYKNDKNLYLKASFNPGGVFKQFDLAAHSLLTIVLDTQDSFLNQSLEWIINEFINKDKLPPAFYPVIKEDDEEWETLRNYHLFDFKNKPHHYHNGGIWWIWLGWLSIALSISGRKTEVDKLYDLSLKYLNSLNFFDFDEYVATDDFLPNGTKKLCYTATGIIFMTLAKKSSNFSKLKIIERPLIKEPLELRDEYFNLSSEIIYRLQHLSMLEKDKVVIGICGESGSGKSVTAKCLQIELEKINISSTILHQDSYYKFPPNENNVKRKADINWVGSNEIKIDLIQSHIEQFKSNSDTLTVPTIDYQKNIFDEQQVKIKGKSVLIVEGVYIFLLYKHLDFKIFMNRTYKDTLSKRKKRSREVYDPFVEQVLEIEHSIVQPLSEIADLIIQKDYSLSEGIGKYMN